MRPCPLPRPPPSLPSLPSRRYGGLLQTDGLSLNTGSNSLQLCQQKKRMACSELLNVHVPVVGVGVGGGAGEVLQKFFPHARY